MKEVRLKRIESVVFRELGEIFASIGREEYPGHLISVSEVRVTPDLSIAKVFISIYPVKDAEEIFNDLKYRKNEIKYEFGTRVRHQLRRIPDLQLYLDETMERLEKIDKLLKKDSENNTNTENQ